jgi:formate dehydrogenase major subunit
MRKAMPSIAGITWDRLEREHAVTLSDASTKATRAARRVHRRFSDGVGTRKFVAAKVIPAAEQPDRDYPLRAHCTGGSSSIGTPAA